MAVQLRPESRGRLRTDSDLVLVRASVLDSKDQFLQTLTRENFKVFDNGVEQQVTSVSLEDAPVSIGILFDASRSMNNVLAYAREAVNRFLLTCNPEDEYSLILVRERPEIALNWSKDKREVVERVDRTPAHGTTALLDGIYLALDHLRHASYKRRLLLVVTDGKDNHSRYTEGQLRDLLRETDVAVCTVGVNIWPESYPEILLSEIADNSGGRYLKVNRARELPEVLSRMNLRYQYVLGYHPTGVPRDGKYHKLGVRLAPGPGEQRLHVYWRRGYYALDSRESK